MFVILTSIFYVITMSVHIVIIVFVIQYCQYCQYCKAGVSVNLNSGSGELQMSPREAHAP
jgi:hypothetical protein